MMGKRNASLIPVGITLRSGIFPAVGRAVIKAKDDQAEVQYITRILHCLKHCHIMFVLDSCRYLDLKKPAYPS